MKLPELKMEAINYGTADWQTQTSGLRSLSQAYGAEAQRKGNGLGVLDYINAGVKVVAQGLDIANDINKSILDKKTSDFQNRATLYQEIGSGKIDSSNKNTEVQKFFKRWYEESGLKEDEIKEAMGTSRTWDAAVQYAIQKGIEKGTIDPTSIRQKIDKVSNEFMYLDENEEPIHRDLAPAYAAKFNLQKTQVMASTINNIKSLQILKGIEGAIGKYKVQDSSETLIAKNDLSIVEGKIKSAKNNIDLAQENIDSLEKKIKVSNKFAPISENNYDGENIKKGMAAREDIRSISGSIFFDGLKKDIDNLDGIVDPEKNIEIRNKLASELLEAKQKEYISNKLGLSEDKKSTLNNQSIDDFLKNINPDIAAEIRKGFSGYELNASIAESMGKIQNYLDVAKETVDIKNSINGYKNDLVAKNNDYSALQKEFLNIEKKRNELIASDSKKHLDEVEKMASEFYRGAGALSTVDADGKIMTGRQVIDGALTKALGETVASNAIMLEKGMPLPKEEALKRSGFDPEKHKNIYLAGETAVALIRQNEKFQQLSNSPRILSRIVKLGDGDKATYSIKGFTVGENPLAYSESGEPIQSPFKEELSQSQLKYLYERTQGEEKSGEKLGQNWNFWADKFIGASTNAWGKTDAPRITLVNMLKNGDIFKKDNNGVFIVDNKTGHYVLDKNKFYDNFKITDDGAISQISMIVEGGLRNSSVEMAAAFREMTDVIGNPRYDNGNKNKSEPTTTVDNVEGWVNAILLNETEKGTIKWSDRGKDSTTALQTFYNKLTPAESTQLKEYMNNRHLTADGAVLEELSQLGVYINPKNGKREFTLDTLRKTLKTFASDDRKYLSEELLRRGDLSNNRTKENFKLIQDNPEAFGNLVPTNIDNTFRVYDQKKNRILEPTSDGAIAVKMIGAESVVKSFSDTGNMKAYAITAATTAQTIHYISFDDLTKDEKAVFLGLLGQGTASWTDGKFFESSLDMWKSAIDNNEFTDVGVNKYLNEKVNTYKQKKGK